MDLIVLLYVDIMHVQSILPIGMEKPPILPSEHERGPEDLLSYEDFLEGMNNFHLYFDVVGAYSSVYREQELFEVIKTKCPEQVGFLEDKIKSRDKKVPLEYLINQDAAGVGQKLYEVYKVLRADGYNDKELFL